jgi:hypothetical protein
MGVRNRINYFALIIQAKISSTNRVAKEYERSQSRFLEIIILTFWSLNLSVNFFHEDYYRPRVAGDTTDWNTARMNTVLRPSALSEKYGHAACALLAGSAIAQHRREPNVIADRDLVDRSLEDY